MNNVDKKEYVELLELLNNIPIIDYLKIPPEEIYFFKTHQDKTYYFKYDNSKPLNKQNISRKTYSLFLNLYYNYIADKETKEKIRELLRINSNRKDDIYSVEKIFAKNNKTDNNIITNKTLIVYKKNSLFKTIINNIKSFFNINFKK